MKKLALVIALAGMFAAPVIAQEKKEAPKKEAKETKKDKKEAPKKEAKEKETKKDTKEATKK